MKVWWDSTRDAEVVDSKRDADTCARNLRCAEE